MISHIYGFSSNPRQPSHVDAIQIKVKGVHTDWHVAPAPYNKSRRQSVWGERPDMAKSPPNKHFGGVCKKTNETEEGVTCELGGIWPWHSNNFWVAA